MTDNHPPVNPLFASSSAPTTVSPSRRAAQSAARLGGYGGMAVAAWLVTAVATGYGVAAADTTGTTSESSSTSSASSTSSTTSTGESSTGSAATSTTGTDSTPATTSTGGGSTSTGTTNTSGTTSSSTQVESGVTISSSGGAHTSTTESATSTAPTSTSAESLEDTSVVETQPKSTEPTASGETAEPTQPSTPPATPAPETEQTTSTPAKPKSNSTHSATVNATTTPTPVGGVDVGTTAAKQSTTVIEPSAAPTAQAFTVNTASSALTTQTLAAAAAPATSTALAATPATGLVGLFNGIVTNLLKPFLAPAPNTPEPVTPVVWAVLAWVRRNLFNQSPTIAYNPTTTVQTGQTVIGNIGATDPEGDALTYTVTQEPQYGTLTIDQATGNFTYTPNDIDYDAAQTDSFTVSVTDGKFNVVSLFSPHSDQANIGLTVLNPTVQRTILNLPDSIKSPANPRYSADGQSIYFAGQPAAGGRSEIYQINIDGTNVHCVTCGVTTSETGNLAKPVPVDDGSGRVLVLVNVAGQSPRYSMLEDGVNGPQLVPITTPPGGGFAIDPQREMRVSPDGTKVLFTRIVVGPNNLLQALPIVGTLTRTANGYEVTDARVVYPTGEGKQWTPDGKGVVILGGQFDAGNVDDIEVDLATGKVTRVTASLDYDEDMDYSPNEQWIAIGSTRGLDALTPMTRIVRQNFLPVYVGAPVYQAYAVPINVSNQEWVVAVGDELNRENGIPLFVTGDGYTARSMPSWNPTGDAVTFWESSVDDPTQSRLVIANLKYTTSVGPVAADRSTPDPTWAPQLSTYVPTTTPLPAVGTYAGVGGGTAVVSEAPDPTDATRTIRTVTYTNYVNEDGMILNGTESADYNASQTAVHYLADVTITGTHTGYLKADATINAFQQSLTGYITSSVDGDVQSLPDPAAAEEAQQSA
jgi:Bacterial Ig domain/WD40-like Beta Propeller Repeat